MTGNIFISYSSRDRDAAHRLCDGLEKRGHRCWIADRDIPLGDSFGTAISRSIRSARAMVVVFSANANESTEITKEMVLADQHKVPLIPARLSDVTPKGDFEYHMSNKQRIDMFPNWEQSIKRLAAHIVGLPPNVVSLPPVRPPVAIAPNLREAKSPVITPRPSAVAKNRQPVQRKWQNRRVLAGGAAAAVLIGCGMLAYSMIAADEAPAETPVAQVTRPADTAEHPYNSLKLREAPRQQRTTSLQLQ